LLFLVLINILKDDFLIRRNNKILKIPIKCDATYGNNLLFLVLINILKDDFLIRRNNKILKIPIKCDAT
ncbi:hypothetical protein, partial [Staphylococcus aureus]|uniref:hypothetical protein n=1 Tax=Staphylococcus aureus TaxID=1280 RepID=UPI001C40B323